MPAGEQYAKEGAVMHTELLVVTFPEVYPVGGLTGRKGDQ